MNRHTLYSPLIITTLLSLFINAHAMDLRIDNVRLYQPESRTFSDLRRLYIDNGFIVDVTTMKIKASEASRTVDAKGQYAVPGLTDLHVHLGPSGSNYGSEFQYLPVSSHFNTNLHLGVTNIVDLFSFDATLNEAKQLQETSLTPNLFYAGALFTNSGGHGTQFGGGALEITDNGAIESLWKQHIARKPHVTKAVIETFGGTTSTLTDEQLIELGRRSKEANLPYFVHVSTLDDAKHAVRAGATALAHGIISESIDDEFVKLMLDNNVAYIPTLAVMLNHSFEKHEQGVSEQSDLLDSVHTKLIGCLFDSVPPAPSWKEHAWSKRNFGYQNIKKLHANGVLIGAGSDAGNPYTLHGVGLHNEIRALVVAGLTPAQAINAATANAATVLNKDNVLGKLEKGYEASFSLLLNNPLQNIEHLAEINALYKSGQAVDRKALAKKNHSTTPAGNDCHSAVIAQLVDTNTIDTLDKNTQWKATTDAIMSGSSAASVENHKEGLLIQTTLGQPTNFGAWAGAELLFNNPTDASEYSGIKITYMGSNMPFYFSIYHHEVKDWDHFFTRLEPSEGLSTIKIPFNSLKQFGFGSPIEWDSERLLGMSIMWRSQIPLSESSNTIMLSSIEYY
jgi:imidazolonepropionase-like amidohydrolase